MGIIARKVAVIRPMSTANFDEVPQDARRDAIPLRPTIVLSFPYLDRHLSDSHDISLSCVHS